MSDYQGVISRRDLRLEQEQRRIEDWVDDTVAAALDTASGTLARELRRERFEQARDIVLDFVGMALEAQRAGVFSSAPVDEAGEQLVLCNERLVKVEGMLQEVAALDSEEQYVTFTVDDIQRDHAGRIVAIFGTRDVWEAAWTSGATFIRRGQSPYIIGEV